jgi:tartrate dehydrogenase/decarboxylase/D-malate dehydrogenase
MATAPPNGQPRKSLKIAVIPGDGIGQEVMPEGLKCLRAVAKR